MSLKYKWIYPKPINKQGNNSLSNKLGLPKIVSQLLVNRGIKSIHDAETFLHPKLSQLDDPFKMHDMRKGLKIIRNSIKAHERIAIYGDYDTDGITSVSIMYSVLKKLGANVHYFIPNRFRDGYGPNLSEYKRIISKGTKLLITTDNGISGLQEIAYARRHGMKVIITDHHDFPNQLPPANAIIMTLFPGHHYPNETDFCGAGVAFKIAQALLGHVPQKYLDLATLGTVADSVLLTKENRVIVSEGVKLIRHSDRPGIRALAKIADVDLTHMTAPELSFSLIPRLNALGRMGDANIGVQLLTTTNMDTAMSLAKITEQRNEKRQDIMHKESREALVQAKKPENLKKCTLVLADKKWFPGVVGIIASRVLEQYYKPTIVIGHLSADDKRGIDRGSGRSIPEFNLFKAMDPLRKTMTSFGGHPAACGLSIKPNKIKALRDSLERAGKRAKLDQAQPSVKPELLLTSSDINNHTLRELNELQPFGQGNQQPLIDLRLPYLYNLSQMGRDNSHLRFTLGESYNSIHVVAWKMGHLYKSLAANPKHIEVAGNLSVNRYKGRKYLQFTVRNIKHYKISISRLLLGEIYRHLYARVSFSKSDLKRISRHIGVSSHILNKALQIFQELHLIRYANAKFTMVLNPVKCSLTDSYTYRTQ